MSHITTVTIELRDHAALALAIEAMGGTVVGEGSHRLFNYSYDPPTIKQGFGFNLPGWRFPLVLQANNTLAFDNYGGEWGNMADIQTLTGHYTIQKARMEVTACGWMSEIQFDGNLLVMHPDGGTFTVTPQGVVDASGFVGTGCDVVTAIELALGSNLERTERFPDQDAARIYLEGRLWPSGPICPQCKSVTARPKGAYRCGACNKFTFTVRDGTIFGASKIPLHKWVYAMYLLGRDPFDILDDLDGPKR